MFIFRSSENQRRRAVGGRLARSERPHRRAIGLMILAAVALAAAIKQDLI